MAHFFSILLVQRCWLLAKWYQIHHVVYNAESAPTIAQLAWMFAHMRGAASQSAMHAALPVANVHCVARVAYCVSPRRRSAANSNEKGVNNAK
jgi:hypothetical protein